MNLRISRPLGWMAPALLALLPAILPAATLSFAGAQQAALTQSRQLAAQDAAIAAARELSVVAGERPDPVLTLGIDNLPANGPDRYSLTRDFMTMRRIGLAQEFTRRDKLDLRRERQQREAGIAASARVMAQTAILRASGKAWMSAYYLQARQALLQEQLHQARQQLAASEAAYRGGRGSQTDTLGVRSDIFMLEDQLQDMDRQLRQARSALARWVGEAPSREPLAGMPDVAHTHLDSGDLERHLKQHPDLIVQDGRIALADTQARLAAADRHADWTAELSYAQRGQAFSDMLSVGVSVPLQWDQARRQNRELAARQAQLEQARAERDDMLRAHVAEVSALVDEWQSGRARLQRYREQLLPLAESRAQSALAIWRGGGGNLTDVLAARRALLDVRLQSLQLEMQTALVWVDLEFLLPQPTGSAS